MLRARFNWFSPFGTAYLPADTSIDDTEKHHEVLARIGDTDFPCGLFRLLVTSCQVDLLRQTALDRTGFPFPEFL